MARHETIPQHDATPVDAERVPFIPQTTIGGFWLRPETRDMMAAAAADRRMSRCDVALAEGGLDAAIAAYAERAVPDLLVIEVDAAAAPLLAGLDRLADLCPPETSVILLGSCNDVSFYRALIRAGIDDYHVLPMAPVALISAIGAVFAADEERQAPVTAFFGTRGGCGASMLAQGVAWSLGEDHDTSVLLADFDLACGTAALRLDLEPVSGVGAALRDVARLDKAVLDRMIVRRGGRFGLLASMADLADPAAPEPAALETVLGVLRTMAAHVVVDLPSGWSPLAARFLSLADRTVLVASPDLVSLRNGGKMAAAMRQARPNDPPPLLVVTQAGAPRRQQIPPERLAKGLDLPLVATVPFDAAVFAAAENEGRPLTQARGAASVGRRVRDLARIVRTGKPPEAPPSRGLLGSLRRRPR